MLKIKRLYTFLLQTFLPVLAMTFGICLFIVLMQFLWKYVEDLVGKGLEILVLAELFFYASLSLIPMALPLAILLAALMTFGNMGERLELLAIKASGVSLLKMMKPLIFLMIGISIGAFFFQNEAMPRINVKFRTLFLSIRQKSPELDIPEGSFYSRIENYSIYVKKKNPETKILHDVMIYDTSKGFDDMMVFVCDSAKLQVSEDKDFLFLSLFDGQRFSNFRQSDIGNNRDEKFVPYTREIFKLKDMIIPFDANFKLMDESTFEGTQISKNITELNQGIDSLNIALDSLNQKDRQIMHYNYLSYKVNDEINEQYEKNRADALTNSEEQTNEISNIGKINFDSLFSTFTYEEKSRFLTSAASQAENNTNSYLFQSIGKEDLQNKLRYYQIEWHRKFTLSFACIIFFFIGVPLGAIIRKGGLGMPVIVSVALFIIYYIFDNVGLKFAGKGVLPVWQGMWLSSFVLFPLGAFLTYKAMNDSALFNVDAYGKFFRKILRIGKRVEIDFSANVNKIPNLSDLSVDPVMISQLQNLPNEKLTEVLQDETYRHNEDMQTAVLSILKERGDPLIDIRIVQKNYKLANKLSKLIMKSALFATLLFIVTLVILLLYLKLLTNILWWLLLFSIIGYVGFYIRTLILYSDFDKSLLIKPNSKKIIILILGFGFFIGLCPYLFKKIRKELNK